LIDRIDYQGANGELKITLSATGAKVLAADAVYQASRDLFLAQRFARHASPLTTTVYTHPSDSETRTRIRRLDC
jgi:late competence protein required for DNA uptake (superfamily II DNA/RNA helicase)